MNEGWCEDQHFIVFDEGESEEATERYGIKSILPGYTVVGLKGWDDFIVRSTTGHLFTIPTVPLAAERLSPLLGVLPTRLEPDPTHAGTIKWHIKPLVFGGSPELDANLTWVDHIQHAELVRWWNQQYRRLADGGV